MKRNPIATRARILDAAYALFYARGFQRTSLDDIAAKAGVTKRTLYYHVRSKDELAGAMLERQHAFVLEQVAAWIDPPSARAGERGKAAALALVERLFAGVESWARKGLASRTRWTGSGFTRMALELADLPGHPARVATRRHKAAVQAELMGRLGICGIADARTVAAQVQMLLEGAMTMALIHGDAGYARLAAAAARKLFR